MFIQVEPGRIHILYISIALVNNKIIELSPFIGFGAF